MTPDDQDARGDARDEVERIPTDAELYEWADGEGLDVDVVCSHGVVDLVPYGDTVVALPGGEACSVCWERALIEKARELWENGDLGWSLLPSPVDLKPYVTRHEP